jgi:hypothetical protein
MDDRIIEYDEGARSSPHCRFECRFQLVGIPHSNS